MAILEHKLMGNDPILYLAQYDDEEIGYWLKDQDHAIKVLSQYRNPRAWKVVVTHATELEVYQPPPILRFKNEPEA